MTDLGVLNEHESMQLLTAHGVRAPRRWLIGPDDPASIPSDEAAGITAFVLKISSTEVVHKSDIGGVVLGVAPEKLAVAINELRALIAERSITADGVLVVEMVDGDAEIIIGGYDDPAFGPCVMVGAGGVLTEVLGDVSFGVCPITRSDAEAMVRSLRIAPLLDGVRGRPALDSGGVVDALLSIGGADGLLVTRPDVVEIDINPLKVSVSGAVAVDAMVRLHAEDDNEEQPRMGLSAVDLDRILHPTAVAVVGASGSGGAPGNVFLSNIREQGFSGRVFPVHPKLESIDGLPTVKSLADLPVPVDYAFVAVAAPRVPGIIESGSGKVGVAQVMSSGFRETEDGQDLERELVATARRVGTRIIGPNCLGVYSPAGGLSFVSRSPKESGAVALISQSGGIGADVVHRGAAAGVRFSAAVTIGNGADLGAADFLEAFLAHGETKVIGMYVEDGGQGRRMFDVMQKGPHKPVVILRGGRTGAGQATAAGHTGSMAGAGHAWDAFARQTGAIMVDSLSEFVDVLHVLDLAIARRSTDVPESEAILLGNGGGVSVLGADSVEAAGLQMHRFTGAALEAIAALDVPPGMAVNNPIDMPAGAFEVRDGQVMEEVFDAVSHAADQAIFIPHMNLPVIRDNLVDPDLAVDRFVRSCGRIAAESGSALPPLLVLRSDGSAESDAFRREVTQRAATFSIPVFREISEAARAGRLVRNWLLSRQVAEGSADV